MKKFIDRNRELCNNRKQYCKHYIRLLFADSLMTPGGPVIATFNKTVFVRKVLIALQLPTLSISPTPISISTADRASSHNGRNKKVSG